MTVLPEPAVGVFTIGLQPDALKPGIHCARTHYIRGVMAFQLARHARTVMLMVPVRADSSFREMRRPAAH